MRKFNCQAQSAEKVKKHEVVMRHRSDCFVGASGVTLQWNARRS
jgi:hypothetical protein